MAHHPRPLSPHLQVYRWQIQMATSILHRATGVLLSGGALVVMCALLCLAKGPEAWARFAECMRSPLGFIGLFLWSWAFCYHLLNGIRHLVQDAGYGFSIPAFVRSSFISVIGSLLLTCAIWGLRMIMGGAA